MNISVKILISCTDNISSYVERVLGNASLRIMTCTRFSVQCQMFSLNRNRYSQSNKGICCCEWNAYHENAISSFEYTFAKDQTVNFVLAIQPLACRIRCVSDLRTAHFEAKASRPSSHRVVFRNGHSFRPMFILCPCKGRRVVEEHRTCNLQEDTLTPNYNFNANPMMISSCADHLLRQLKRLIRNTSSIRRLENSNELLWAER